MTNLPLEDWMIDLYLRIFLRKHFRNNVDRNFLSYFYPGITPPDGLRLLLKHPVCCIYVYKTTRTVYKLSMPLVYLKILNKVKIKNK